MGDHRNSAIQFCLSLENQRRFLEELTSFVSIPSVSTDPLHKPDVLLAADWLVQQLHKLGLHNIQIFPTANHPIVFGESIIFDKSAPTVLIYGHYDVQPPDPLDLWISDPFKPDVRGENLYGRGASDMKGPTLASIKALECIRLTGDHFPVNVKFLLEGEEEIGSPSLHEFIPAHKELLTSDFALNADTGMISAELPTITYALRGLAYFEIRVYGPDRDLHSGIYGGAVHNPAQVLCDLIAGMHDDQGRITLPGFYKKVRPIDAEERQALAKLPMGKDFYLKQTGTSALWGEFGYSPVEQTGARPTLEVNGLLSGFTGKGSKTVLPAWAMAKISTRLVPDQDPEDVYEQLVEYFTSHAPKSVRYEIEKMAGGCASISNKNSPSVKAMEKAMETVWGVSPAFRREGGSVPVVGQFQEFLGIESVNVGFSLPDDNLHSPNEKIHLPTWYRGIETLIHFFYNLKG